jgi:hypothetical protein
MATALFVETAAKRLTKNRLYREGESIRRHNHHWNTKLNDSDQPFNSGRGEPWNANIEDWTDRDSGSGIDDFSSRTSHRSSSSNSTLRRGDDRRDRRDSRHDNRHPEDITPPPSPKVDKKSFKERHPSTHKNVSSLFKHAGEAGIALAALAGTKAIMRHDKAQTPTISRDKPTSTQSSPVGVYAPGGGVVEGSGMTDAITEPGDEESVPGIPLEPGTEVDPNAPSEIVDAEPDGSGAGILAPGTSTGGGAESIPGALENSGNPEKRTQQWATESIFRSLLGANQEGINLMFSPLEIYNTAAYAGGGNSQKFLDDALSQYETQGVLVKSFTWNGSAAVDTVIDTTSIDNSVSQYSGYVHRKLRDNYNYYNYFPYVLVMVVNSTDLVLGAIKVTRTNSDETINNRIAVIRLNSERSRVLPMLVHNYDEKQDVRNTNTFSVFHIVTSVYFPLKSLYQTTATKALVSIYWVPLDNAKLRK